MPDHPAARPAPCPICGRPASPRRVGARSPSPFCSDRCRQVDLGRWLTGAYALPLEEPPAPVAEEGGEGEKGG
ncbi:MAG: DNA gyrase inhibitor YacG [Roseococcus sp.]|nr:DNA gyrase inhibitor YacG [Roseococcus sp.]